MSELRKNDIITLDIADMNNLGYGVGRHGGLVVFVRGAVIGDRLECRIIKVNKSYLVGRIEKIITPSPKRIADDCRHSSCGGCVYRNISYDYELELKREYVKNAFKQAGLPDVEVGEVRSTDLISGYRNKAQYPVGQRPDGTLYAGFYAANSHRIAGDADCPLQPPVFAEIAKEICRECTVMGIKAYDEESRRGLLRHIYLRRADMTGEIMVCLVINGDTLPGGDRLASHLVSRFPEITGILLNKNKKNTNVVLGDEYVTLWGRGYIEDILCGLRFKISPESFYQVNHDGAELLYSIAREKALSEPLVDRLADQHITEEKKATAAPRKGILLDLYCGTGTIGLSMAADFDEVIGIDIVPGAIECAKENALKNGIKNAAFFCGDASETGGLLAAAERERGSETDADKDGDCGRVTATDISELFVSPECERSTKIDADTVILDPPRKGSTPELINYIASRGISRIVYVSCSPDTLARDCALFRQLGYTIGEVTPVDMFPRTGHVECLVLMSRVKD